MKTITKEELIDVLLNNIRIITSERRPISDLNKQLIAQYYIALSNLIK